MDHKTSELSNEQIKQHLNECALCSLFYNDAVKKLQEKHSLNTKLKDDLEKHHQKSIHKLWISIGFVLTLFLVVTFMVYTFWAKKTTEYRSLIEVKNGVAKIELKLTNKKEAFSGCKLMKIDGQQQLVVYAVNRTIFHKGATGTFEIPLSEIEEDGVLVKDSIVLKDGDIISEYERKIYDAKHLYVGNMVNNNRLAQAIGISKQISDYYSELQTSVAPYGWTFVFSKAFQASQQEDIDQKMIKNSVLLLALVDNLDVVTWRYQIYEDSQIYEVSNTMTSDYVNALLNENVKSYSADIKLFHKLMERLKSDEGIQP